MQMQLLLWIEELQHEVDIRQYDIPQAKLEPKSGGLVGLVVRACMPACVFLCWDDVQHSAGLLLCAVGACWCCERSGSAMRAKPA